MEIKLKDIIEEEEENTVITRFTDQEQQLIMLFLEDKRLEDIAKAAE